MTQATVHLVDDDPSVVESLSTLLSLHGFNVRCYHSSQVFLDSPLGDRPACAVLDLRMPGLNGIEVQRLLRQRGASIPLIFISGHGDIESAVTAMRDGAVDFLTKPFETDNLLATIRKALETDAREQTAAADKDELAERLARLTPREREVFDLLVAGMSAKKIGLQLGISHRTAEKHRDRILKKMCVQSPVELVHAAVALGLPIQPADNHENASA